MSNEENALVRQAPVIVPRTLDEVVTLSERISKSGLLPKELQNKVPEVMMQIMAGQELGLAPMASLRSFSIITGKPVMSADAMVALCLGSGKCEYFRRKPGADADSVTYVTKRRGEPEQSCTWTMTMAKDAALHQKDNWRLFKRQMLASRAKSELARDVYPDVLAGVYSADEISDESPPEPRRESDAIDAEFVDVAIDSTDDAPEVVAIDDMESVEALKAHAPKIAALGLAGAAKKRATDRYNRKMGLLKAKAEQPKTESAATTEPAA